MTVKPMWQDSTPEFILLSEFLQWMKEKHGAEFWTPDGWAVSGMSPDHISALMRVRAFIGERQHSLPKGEWGWDEMVTK